MDTLQLTRLPLEPIEEESKQEDESEGADREEENLESQVDAETEEVVAENERGEEEEGENDDDGSFLFLRPGRVSRSVSQKSFIQIQSDNQVNENNSVSDLSARAPDLSDDDVPLPKSAKEKRSSGEKLRLKVSKKYWKKQTSNSSRKRKRKINKELGSHCQ
ncbi:death domain-associated protein 6-like [Nematolebias whitei]|uniref:death domain-associated protein 6-like n=1 Tax=Nematolebias whitei TaxID=451745 RepID=UPI001897B40B|nr:death domain-associated protein 6-like [Nematolebias whitei]